LFLDSAQYKHTDHRQYHDDLKIRYDILDTQHHFAQYKQASILALLIPHMVLYLKALVI